MIPQNWQCFLLENPDMHDVLKPATTVFGYIGVVYVEMHGIGERLADITMVLPFIVPCRVIGNEPAATFRFHKNGIVCKRTRTCMMS